jgi:hypothetical protein
MWTMSGSKEDDDFFVEWYSAVPSRICVRTVEEMPKERPAR